MWVKQATSSCSNSWEMTALFSFLSAGLVKVIIQRRQIAVPFCCVFSGVTIAGEKKCIEKIVEWNMLNLTKQVSSGWQLCILKMKSESRLGVFYIWENFHNHLVNSLHFIQKETEIPQWPHKAMYFSQSPIVPWWQKGPEAQIFLHIDYPIILICPYLQINIVGLMKWRQ